MSAPTNINMKDPGMNEPTPAIITTTTSAPDITTAPAGEETISDIAVSNHLGYSHPADFRKLIERNLASLEAMGPLLHRVAMAEAGEGAEREATEYRLSQAQVTFLVGKAGTKWADSLAVVAAEVVALYLKGGLVAADEQAKKALTDSATRGCQRFLQPASEAQLRAAQPNASTPRPTATH